MIPSSKVSRSTYSFHSPITHGFHTDTHHSDFCTGKYSDMRLVAGDGTIYHVHKVVLCHQSKFFENAMKEGRFRVQ